MKKAVRYLAVFSAAFLLFCSAGDKKPVDIPAPDAPSEHVVSTVDTDSTENQSTSDSEADFPTLADIPAYVGEPYAVLNDNEPYFTKEAREAVSSFELYSPRDELGRCGTAYACLSVDLMPTEERKSIGNIKPSGWQSTKYDIVDGGYLYNRCHLIAYRLAGENANPDNLITGTRYLNTRGMLPFENMTADCIKETSYHVLYRVTPLYNESDAVARGVVMEAYSTEDDGESLCFCVFCYNVQPGISIDYATGESERIENTEFATVSEIIPSTPDRPAERYILNTKNKKIHRPSCPSVSSVKEEHREESTENIAALIRRGYSLCHNCFSS